MTLSKISEHKQIYIKYHGIDYNTKYKCEICGTLHWISHLTIHHLIPRRVAPSRVEDITNMTLICRPCHTKIHPENESLETIIRLRKEIKWYKHRIDQYLRQIDEMRSTNPSVYLERYIQTNKRLHMIFNQLREKGIDLEIPDSWLADVRVRL